MAKVVTDRDIGTSLVVDTDGKLNINNQIRNDTYVVKVGTGFETGIPKNPPKRYYVMVNALTKFGIVHLDFKRTNSSATVVGTLPSNCPTPANVIEGQTNDGALIWIEQGKRTVNMSGGANNVRYIVNLMGYFN